MSMNPKIKNPLVLSVVATVFLIPVLILTHFLFREVNINTWVVMLVDVVIYFVIIFLVFLYYGNIGKRRINKTFFVDRSFKNRDIYRSRINYEGKHSFNIAYRNTELFVSGDKDIKKEVERILEDIYRQFDIVAKRDPSFMTSLIPVKIKSFYSPAIKRMCMLSSEFKVGPMASVAGTVNDIIATKLSAKCVELFIENGGDLYIKSEKDINVGIYARNKIFKRQDYLENKSRCHSLRIMFFFRHIRSFFQYGKM